jgi:hypothetical protein
LIWSVVVPLIALCAGELWVVAPHGVSSDARWLHTLDRISV